MLSLPLLCLFYLVLLASPNPHTMTVTYGPTVSIHCGSPVQREDLSSLLPLMLRLEVIHQLVLSHETIHTLARTISNRAVELLWASLMALQVTVKVAWAAKGFGAADMRTGESTIERGGSAAGDGRWSVARVVLCGRHGRQTEQARMIRSRDDVISSIACEGGSICVIHVRRYGLVRCKEAWEVDLHMSIEALFIGANKVAAVIQTDQLRLYLCADFTTQTGISIQKKKKTYSTIA